MTFPASLCCPTDALSVTNGEKKINKTRETNTKKKTD